MHTAANVFCNFAHIQSKRYLHSKELFVVLSEYKIRLSQYKAKRNTKYAIYNFKQAVFIIFHYITLQSF